MRIRDAQVEIFEFLYVGLEHTLPGGRGQIFARPRTPAHPKIDGGTPLNENPNFRTNC